MKLNARGGISIFELCVYLPAIALAAFVCSRHGFGRSSGWVYTLILCLVRIIGACCQLATYDNSTQGLLEATIILDTIGLAPLLLATLGLLSRCIDSIHETSGTFLNVYHFRLLQLVVSLGLILSIVGGTSSISSTGVYKVQGTSEAGVVLYTIAWFALCFIALLTVVKIASVRHGETKIVWAAILALPFILVRMIYTLLTVFHHDSTFNAVNGSVAVLTVMAVLEEMIVVGIFLFAGLCTDALPATASRTIEHRPWKGSMAGAQFTQRGNRGRSSQGPIHNIVGLGVAALRKEQA